MTTAPERLDFGTRRSWFVHLMDRLLEPPKVKPRRLDPRMVSPYLLRDMGLLDPVDEPTGPERSPARW